LIKHLPNTITIGNLLCGCLAILFATQDDTIYAAALMGCAAILDFFDGFAARLLKVSGELGKQLDSLADMVSFGVVPGLIFFSISKGYFGAQSLFPYLFLAIVAFSALRLAIFNIDTKQTDHFIGVPTPANAMFIGSLPFILQQQSFGLNSVIHNEVFLITFPLLSAYLLVAQLPLLALKFKHFGIKGNEFRWALIIISALCVIIFKFAGIAFSIILYIIISLIQHIIIKKQTHEI
jgi:CDP-diacylglycerol---serine O-phosphatidyltransferase